jgi:CHC2 zinc finger
MIHPTILREIAERYHRALPDDVRDYLKGRGIPPTFIERHLLGWNGERITFPVFNGERDVIGFRYVTPVTSEGADAVSSPGLDAELYGWDTLGRKPHRVVICGSESDRLLLEANGFAAVSSTGGQASFLDAWAVHFEDIARIYVAFTRDLAGAAAASKVQRLMPRARIVTLPPEVGQSGTVSDFFIGLGRTKIDFEVLLAQAEGKSNESETGSSATALVRPRDKSQRRRAERLRQAVRLHEVAATYTDLEADGGRLLGRCPLHEDAGRSFVIDLETDTYRCSGCGASGDVIQFLMDKESMTLGQVLQALEGYEITHELHGTS